MDGPYEFTVTLSGEVQLKQRRLSGELNLGTFRRPESVQRLWQSLHRAAVAVLSECDTRGRSSTDIDRLRRHIPEGPHGISWWNPSGPASDSWCLTPGPPWGLGPRPWGL